MALYVLAHVADGALTHILARLSILLGEHNIWCLDHYIAIYISTNADQHRCRVPHRAYQYPQVVEHSLYYPLCGWPHLDSNCLSGSIQSWTTCDKTLSLGPSSVGALDCGLMPQCSCPPFVVGALVVGFHHGHQALDHIWIQLMVLAQTLILYCWADEPTVIGS